MGHKGAQLNHSAAVGGATQSGDRMPDIPPFGLGAAARQGLGLSEDLLLTAKLGSMCGGWARNNLQHSLGQGAQGPQGRAA